MKRVCLALLVGAVTLAFTAPAMALPDFKKAFEAKYVKPSKSEEFAEAFKSASCNTCHVKGEKKDVRNHYGKILAEMIPGDAGKRIKEAADKDAEKAKVNAEAMEAMKKAEEKEAPGGGTYGELFKAHKLPPAPKE